MLSQDRAENSIVESEDCYLEEEVINDHSNNHKEGFWSIDVETTKNATKDSNTDNDDASRKCDSCELQFDQQKKLNDHLWIQSNTRTFLKCDSCASQVNLQVGVDKHDKSIMQGIC